MMNIHASGGRAMMTKAAESLKAWAAKENEEVGAGLKPAPTLLAVTVLTSLSEAELKEVGVTRSLKEQVVELALLAQSCGVDGVVASGEEIAAIRQRVGKNFVIVTPGVRPAWAAASDQKRIVTPKEAIESGADYIVVGRPITQAENPRKAVEKILNEM
jgi:orotidine-5'-phosphate decarboxylase